MAKFNETLAPFAAIYAGAVVMLDSLDDDQLAEFITACAQTTRTNCWCYTYRAAQCLVSEAREIQRTRNQLAKVSP